MELIDQPLQQLFLIKSQQYQDTRGYFSVNFNQEKISEITGFNGQFIQDNESYSIKNVLRGLHFQKAPYGQSKLVRVVKGKVLDVVVDIRKKSRDFGKIYKCELSEENKLMLLIPKGFAHGFVVLSQSAIFQYKVDAKYSPSSESGIRFDDPDLAIDWGVSEREIVISQKDRELPFLKSVEY